MTNLVLNTKELEIEVIPITKAEFGKWYRIVNFEWDDELVGEIGVLTINDNSGKALVCPSGRQFTSRDIFLQEIQNVEVICS